MLQRTHEKQFTFPYLYDESQDVARSYGAERTPEFFIFDASGTLRYHGAPDDNYEDEQAIHPSLRQGSSERHPRRSSGTYS
jgi:peroxiredoxin